MLSKEQKLQPVEHDISGFVEVLKSESQEINASGFPHAFEFSDDFNGPQLKQKRWYINSYENGAISYWNSNKFQVDSALIDQQEFPCFYNYGDDVYCVFKPENSCYHAFRISNDGRLHERLISFYPELDEYSLNWKEVVNLSTIKELPFSPTTPNGKARYIPLLLVTVVLLLFMLFYAHFTSSVFKTILSGIVLLMPTAAALLLTDISLNDFLFSQTQNFASLRKSNTIFLLANHLAAGFGILYLLHFLLGKWNKWFVNGILFCGLFFGIDLVLSTFRSVVNYSDILFNFEKLFDLSAYTFFVVTLFGSGLLAIWFLCSVFVKRNRNASSLLYSISLGGAIFLIFQLVDSNRSLVTLLIPIVILIMGILAFVFFKDNRKRNWVLFFISLITIAVSVHKSRINRHTSEIKSYAKSLVANTDVRAELILKSIENKLVEEFLAPEDYSTFIARKEVVENRIKQLYFSQYLEKYDVEFLSFDPDGNNINLNNIYSLEDLDNIYNNYTERTQSSYFYQIKNPASLNGFIGKYENCDVEGHYGTTYILLKPRLVQSEFLYPEIFANQLSQRTSVGDDYSYGIYFNSKLINQAGVYPYALNSTPKGKEKLSLLRYYHHHSFTQNGNYEVVLTKDETFLKKWTSSFTFSFLLLIPLLLFCSLIAYFVLGKDNSFTASFLPISGKYISTRIQTSLTVILLIGLLFSVYFIINFIRANYNQNLENQLLTTVKNIGSQMQNKVELEKKLLIEEERLLMLNEEASNYKVDINLFSKEGKLLSSTKPYLLEKQVISNQMNPQAFRQLSLSKNSQLLIKEEIEGSTYLSAYVPLFNNKNGIIGYLNTPYFAKNEVLNKQISSLVVNIINIYFLLVIGALLIALFISKRISKPLLLIQEKMSTTDLTGGNELIRYDREDEIGQLVKQYNHMVGQLENSANQLAESEREGAWREMAKQVAHEIKNPLTPMKLSIQHLQRAYESGSGEKLDALFSKTSKLLIEQIESLSAMASEFSSFAKMPEDQYEVFNITDVLEKTIALYEPTAHINFEKEIESNVLVNADPEQISRVFNNIIKNAIQAIPEGQEGLIKVSLKTAKGIISIRIKDNGTGINESIQNKVFVPNFSTKNSGMGLGLAITKKIIETAHGSISFTTEKNKGTCFTLSLPLVEED